MGALFCSADIVIMVRDFGIDLLLYGIVRAIFAASWIAILKLLTSNLSPEAFGTYSLVLSGMTIIAILSTSWLGSSFVRFHPEDTARKAISEFNSSALFISMIAIGVSSTIFVAIISMLANTGFIEVSAVAIAAISFSFVGLCLYQLSCAFFRAVRAIKYYATLVVVQVVIFLSACYWILPRFDDQVLGVFALLSCSYLPALTIWLIRRTSVSGIKWDALFIRIKRYVYYGMPLLLVGLSVQLNSSADQYILRYFYNTETVGMYAAYYVFSEKIVMATAGLVSLAGVPIMFREWETEKYENAYRMLFQMLFAFCLVAVLLFAAVSFFGAQLAGLIIDAQYKEGSAIIPFVAAGAILAGLSSIMADALTIHKRTLLLAKCYFSASVVNILANLVFVPTYGIMGAAICTLGSYLFLVVIIAWNVQKTTGLFTHGGGFVKSIRRIFQVSGQH